MSFTADYTHFFCGTTQSNIYLVDAERLVPELRNTCHYEKINDIAFPKFFNQFYSRDYSEVFATCSMNEIRIWNARNRQELLRIQVPNIECHCVGFMHDGKSIISGWSDGKVRAFYPQSGKLMFAINDAHVHGVTSIAMTSDCNKFSFVLIQNYLWRNGRRSESMENNQANSSNGGFSQGAQRKSVVNSNPKK